jgi:predicted enzyme related to lactoylglutathione lyase
MNDAQFPADVPSHWSVTFSVDDPDAIAARAAELGRRVIAPPFDAGPVRIALLADPQGAVFTVSRYQPD